MADIKKEFKLFEEYLKIYSKAVKVKNVTRRYLSNDEGNNYNDCTIEQFIVLYKLSRMEELGVVNEKIASGLRDMIDMKRHIGTIIGEEAKKEMYNPTYQSTDLPKLHKISETIDTQLKKYHLTIGDINFTDMIDETIKAEHSELIKENKNIKIKKID